MLRYKTKTRPGLVAFYDIRPGNGTGPFLQPRSPHGALQTGKLCSSVTSHWVCDPADLDHIPAQLPLIPCQLKLPKGKGKKGTYTWYSASSTCTDTTSALKESVNDHSRPHDYTAVWRRQTANISSQLCTLTHCSADIMQHMQTPDISLSRRLYRATQNVLIQDCLLIAHLLPRWKFALYKCQYYYYYGTSQRSVTT